MHIGFPFGLDATGCIRQVPTAQYLRDLIEQVLFSAPGERVMRPEFGSGAHHLVFEPTGEELAATAEYAVRAALQRYLGDMLVVHAIRVQSEQATVRITLQYALASQEFPGQGGALRTEIFEGEL